MICLEINAELRVPNHEGWWNVPIAEVSSEASVNEAREEYEEAVKAQRCGVVTGQSSRS